MIATTTIASTLDFLGIDNERLLRLLSLLMRDFDVPTDFEETDIELLEMDLIREEARHREIGLLYPTSAPHKSVRKAG